MTFAVVAIDVSSPDVDLGPKLRGTARKFAPHITIVPRVSASALRARMARGWPELRAAVEALRRSPLELRGPTRIADELDWYESDETCRGHRLLVDLHRLAMDRLLDPLRPAPDMGFVRQGYRPHMTTAWKTGTGRGGLLPRMLRVQAVELVIYSYRTTPWAGSVRREVLTCRSAKAWLGRPHARD